VEVEPPTMSTSQVLQRLYSLDASSPDFLRYLYCLIQTDEEEQYLSSLQGLELVRLVDFLDGVSVPSPQPLSSLRNRYRSLVSHRSSTTFSGDVCTNYELSVAITRSYHPRTSFHAISPELVMTQSSSAGFPTYGKALTTASRSVSDT
jgi:hypothetical protein